MLSWLCLPHQYEDAYLILSLHVKPISCITLPPGVLHPPSYPLPHNAALCLLPFPMNPSGYYLYSMMPLLSTHPYFMTPPAVYN